MTLKVTFAVWNLFNSHTSWNIARVYQHSASRGSIAFVEFLDVAWNAVKLSSAFIFASGWFACCAVNLSLIRQLGLVISRKQQVNVGGQDVTTGRLSLQYASTVQDDIYSAEILCVTPKCPKSGWKREFLHLGLPFIFSL